MDGLLIFDQQNDIIYFKFNNAMKEKIYGLARQQELVAENAKENDYLNSNVIIQIFSPIIASQRIMYCQFDNSYSVIECENNLTFTFEESLGYLFVIIGNNKSEEYFQRMIGICSAFAKRICGPDIYSLKTIPIKSELFTNLLTTWEKLYECDHAILIEAVEHLLVNYDLKTVANKALESAIENLKQDPHSQRSHGILFVKNKFLSIFSSKQAQELSPSDIVFLSIYYQSLDLKLEKRIHSNLLFLQGQINGHYAGCIPHIVHTTKLDNDVILLLLIEYGSLQVSSGLYDIFFALHKTQKYQMQNDIDSLRPAFDSLDSYVKQTIDALKKAKYNCHEIEMCIKKFANRWDLLKRKYIELFKHCDKDLVVSIESNIPGFMETLKDIFRLTCLECSILENGLQRVTEISVMVDDRLMEFSEFLCVQAERNFGISMRNSITLNKYLEEFPGLVHFIYIDRTNGRIITPNLNFTTNETSLIPKAKVWSMVEYTRSYIQKGHMSMLWKDTAFCYSYFVWFEDQYGAPLKPKELPNTTTATAIKPQVVPGILSGEFYQWLIETCFPKSNKVKCFELYCVHLGLASATCVLEHNRRLAATIMEVSGLSTCSTNEAIN